jgi:hypothetical protein
MVLFLAGAEDILSSRHQSNPIFSKNSLAKVYAIRYHRPQNRAKSREFSAMRQQCCFRGLMLALAFMMPISAADEKKDDTTKSVGDSEKISTAHELTGKLTKISGQTNAFTLRVEYLDLQPNASHRAGASASKEVQHLIKQQQELARLQAQIQQTRNPAKRLAKLQKFAAKVQRQQVKAAHTQHLPYKTVTRHQDLQLLASEDVKVRLAHPSADFDEQEKPRKHAPEELRKLKGPLWGYPGEWSNLQTGQLVKVFLSREKNGPATEIDSSDDPKTDDKKKSEVAMIYILEDAKKK